MSFAAEYWAWEQRCGGVVAKSVLAYLSFRASRHTGDCWPSMATIVRAVEAGEVAVRKAVKELVKRGKVEREQRYARNGRCISTLYRLPVVAVPSSAELEPDPMPVRPDSGVLVEPEPTPSNSRETPPPPTPSNSREKPLGSKIQPEEKEERERASARAPAGPPSVDSKTPAEGSKQREAPARRARGTPLPDDWNPTAADRAFARARGYDPAELVLAFALKQRDLGNVSADWSAKFQLWVINEPKFEQRRQSVPGSAKPGKLDWLDERIEARQEAAGVWQ